MTFFFQRTIIEFKSLVFCDCFFWSLTFSLNKSPLNGHQKIKFVSFSNTNNRNIFSGNHTKKGQTGIKESPQQFCVSKYLSSILNCSKGNVIVWDEVKNITKRQSNFKFLKELCQIRTLWYTLIANNFMQICILKTNNNLNSLSFSQKFIQCTNILIFLWKYPFLYFRIDTVLITFLFDLDILLFVILSWNTLF